MGDGGGGVTGGATVVSGWWRRGRREGAGLAGKAVKGAGPGARAGACLRGWSDLT